MDKKPSYEELGQKIISLEALIQTQNENEVELLEEISDLKQTRKYYDTLMQNTEDYFLICDSNGIPLAFNESYRKKTEELIDTEMVPGVEAHKLTNNPEAVKNWDLFHSRVLMGEKFKAEFAVEINNELTHYETIFCPIKKDKKITGFTEITRNITKHKEAEEALRESHSFNSSLLEHSPDAIIVFNTDTSIRYVNPAFEKITGYTSEEALAAKVPYPWWVEDSKFGTIEQRAKLGLKGIYHSERQYRKKNGDYFWIDLNVTPIYHNGELRYSLSTWTDITERKNSDKEKNKLEERLQRSQKMESLGLLAGGVAHDLNNVLAGIVSYPELLLLDLPEDSKLRKPIETIRESGNRAVAIVQDLLTIARGVAITKKTVNLNSLINDYLESPEFKRLEQYSPSVTINTNLDSTLLNINGSNIHLRKMLMNLVSNAYEAIEGSGSITISTTNRYLDKPLTVYDDVKTGEYAVLSVLDNGAGIPPEDLSRIFEPFYSKKVMGRSGTGLGLAVVWNVIQEHSGYINITSNKDWTTFDLYFPITRSEISDTDSTIPLEMLKGNGEKILIVDDMESQRDISSRMLEILGYRVNTVSSGEEAVEYLKEHNVDLVLLDMIMDPGINGRETYEQILKIRPSQKAIIVSGFAETEDVKKAQKSGAGQFVKKPLTLQNIATSIKRVLVDELRNDL